MKSNVIAAALLVSAMSTLAFGQAAQVKELGAAADAAAAAARTGAVVGRDAAAGATAAGAVGKSTSLFDKGNVSLQAQIKKTSNSLQCSADAGLASIGNGPDRATVYTAATNHIIENGGCLPELGNAGAQVLGTAVVQIGSYMTAEGNKPIEQASHQDKVNGHMAAIPAMAKNLNNTSNPTAEQLADAAERDVALCHVPGKQCTLSAAACEGAEEAASKFGVN